MRGSEPAPMDPQAPAGLGAALAHDLQQPLFALGGLLDLLDSDELRPDQREWVARMRMAHDNLVAALDELRTGQTARLPMVGRWFDDLAPDHFGGPAAKNDCVQDNEAPLHTGMP